MTGIIEEIRASQDQIISNQEVILASQDTVNDKAETLLLNQSAILDQLALMKANQHTALDKLDEIERQVSPLPSPIPPPEPPPDPPPEPPPDPTLPIATVPAIWNDNMISSTNMPLEIGPPGTGYFRQGLGDQMRTPHGLRIDYQVRPWKERDGPRNEFGRWRNGVTTMAYDLEPLHEERWYSFRVKVNQSEQTPEGDNQRSVLWQMHGPSHMNPCLSLDFYVSQRRWVWFARSSDNKPHRIVWPEEGKSLSNFSGNMTWNTWVWWVIHAKWSSGSDGFIEIIRNGQVEKGWDGENYFGGTDQKPYQQAGCYYPDGRQAHPQFPDMRRRIWFKDYQIGDKNNKLSDFE